MSSFLRPHGLYVTHKAPVSVGFSMQEYWSELPFPTAGYLLDSGIEVVSPASLLHCRQILYCWATGEVFGLKFFLGFFQNLSYDSSTFYWNFFHLLSTVKDKILILFPPSSKFASYLFFNIPFFLSSSLKVMYSFISYHRNYSMDPLYQGLMLINTSALLFVNIRALKL